MSKDVSDKALRSAGKSAWRTIVHIKNHRFNVRFVELNN